MAFTERLALLITANPDDAVRGLKKVETNADRSLGKAEQRIDKMGASFTKAGAVMLTTGGLMAAGMWKAGEAASDLNETVSQSEQIFGDASDQIATFAKSASDIGQSERAAREAVNTFGLLFTNIGKTGGEAADMSETMAVLASDMASFKNTTPEEAVTALGAALRGESEPIRRYGVMLDDATLKQQAMSMGLIETTTGTLPPAIKAQAAYAEILEQTSTLQGDFARTAEDPANASRVMKAEIDDLTASLGQSMLPIMKDVIGGVSALAEGFNNLPTPVQSTISKVALGTTAFLLAGGAISSVAGQVIKMRSSLSGLPGKLSGASRATKGLAMAGGALAAVGVAAALYEWGQSLTGFKMDLDAFSKAPIDDLVDTFEKLEGSGLELRMFEEALEGAPGAAIELRNALADLGHDVSELDVMLEEHNEQQENVQRRAELASEALEGEEEAAEDLIPKIRDLADASEIAAQRQEDLFDAMDKVIDEALGGLDAIANWEEALDGLRDSAKDGATSLDLSTEAGRKNHESLSDLVEAAKDRLEQMHEEGRTAEEVRTAQELMALQIQAVSTELGIAEEDSRTYTEALNDIPTEIMTRVSVDDGAARAAIASINEALAGTDRTLGSLMHGRNPAEQRSTPQFPGGPAKPRFGDGGIVPGPIGKPVEIVAHGGETIIDTHKPGVTAGGVNIVVNPAPGMNEEAIGEAAGRYAGWAVTTSGAR